MPKSKPPDWLLRAKGRVRRKLKKVDWLRVTVWLTALTLGIGGWLVIWLLGRHWGGEIKDWLREEQDRIYQEMAVEARGEYVRNRNVVDLANWCLGIYGRQEGEGATDYLNRCLDERRKDWEDELQLKERLKSFLKLYGSPLGDSFLDSAIAVEKASGIDGFASFSVALSGAESTFGKAYPQGSHNVWGISSARVGYGSWLEGHIALANLLKKHYGRSSITPQDLLSINRWYASSKAWHNSVRFFMEKI